MQKAEGCCEARTLCWVMMPDHMHWLMELQNHSLTTTVGRLKSRPTLLYNRLKSRNGRIWQRNFHDQPIRHDADVLPAARYIVNNAVRAGLVMDCRHYPLWDAIWL